jgi:2,3-bisphosphoglycerate-dependent phosphoglycerate mutase
LIFEQSGIDDEDIAQVSFPKGMPVVYKFDTNMKPLIPKDERLTQVFTSGQFLEKPGLLKKAMDSTKEWEGRVPGTTDYYTLPNIAKRMTTTEKALLYLKEEQKMWNGSKKKTHDVDRGNNDGEIILAGTFVKNDTMVNEDDERFEEMTNEVQINENVSVNQNSLRENDPCVVFIRHGRTPHNKLALFTGWEDPPLAIEGEEDARWAGRLLKKHGFQFDVVYTSWLYRAIQTAWFVLEEMDQLWLPLISSWRLNERHYGDLTGKSKKMVANIYGEDQLKKWRRGYRIRPPPVSSYSFSYPGNDKRRIKYVKDIRVSFTETFCRSIEDRKLRIHRKFPKCESLFDCMNRSIPFYTERIVPEAVAKGKRVLITSHENAIRGILMHLCEIPEECMNDLHLPNGVPLVYNVKRKCISLLDDGTGEDPLVKYDFGSAAQYLFRPCEIGEDEDWYTGP